MAIRSGGRIWQGIHVDDFTILAIFMSCWEELVVVDSEGDVIWFIIFDADLALADSLYIWLWRCRNDHDQVDDASKHGYYGYNSSVLSECA